MKIRNGFVSNSSSSSFIIASKKYLEEVSKEEINDIFKLSDPNIWMGEVIFKTIINKARQVDWLEWLQERYYYQNHGPGWVEECLQEFEEARYVKGLLDRGFIVYTGEFESEYSNLVEHHYSKNDLNYESDNLIISHEGGY
jgi:hypothetical protein